jgi:transcriptional regulator with XRE-family HTH domain
LDDSVHDDPWYEISSRIESERTRRGMTRQALADRVGVSRTTIFNWESGRRIPIEKCAAIAEGLEIDPADLLRIHPEVPEPVREQNGLPAPTAASSSRTEVRVTRRDILYVAAGIAALIVGIGFAAASTAATECFGVGAALPSVASEFRDVYEEAGGRQVLGCMTDEVHKFGPGVVQAFAGDEVGDGLIMSLDRERAYIIAGQAQEAHRWIADGSAADVAGYPIDTARRCEDTIVIRLSGGSSGAGALVQADSGDHYVWIAGGVWPAYVDHGGPLGALGPPIDSGFDDSGHSATFVGGTVTARHGEPAEILFEGAPTNATAFDPTVCPGVSVREAALEG